MKSSSKTPKKHTSSLPKTAPKAAPILPRLAPEDIDAGDRLLTTLFRAVSVKRGHGSPEEARFVCWLAERLPVTAIDIHGNLHVDLRKRPEHRTMFTAHTDTVHYSTGVNTVLVDGAYWRPDGAPLGADDGAGVALLVYLIDHQVPGYYVFFRGEECGGIGSKGLYESDPELFTHFDRAIAFDRAGYSDVITHQGGTRCASDEFAEALAATLTPEDFSLAYLPSDGGIYTDTAEFVDTIPECTNVSVGYFHQHSDREYQDIPFLQKLAAQLLRVDWDNLPTRRDPDTYDSLWSQKDDFRWAAGSTGYRGWTERDDAYDGAGPHFVLDELDKTVLAACNAHIDGTDRRGLINLIANYIDPETPEKAREEMDPTKLTSTTVSYFVSDLKAGYAQGADVLVDLYYSATED